MKMNLYKQYWLLLIFATTFASCEQNINIDLPYTGDKIVLNAILTNDSIVYAHITKSEPTEKNSNSFTELQGCKVELFENDILKETLKEKTLKKRLYYVSSAKIKNGAKYTIRVSFAGLASVEGSDVIPAKPAFIPTEYMSQPKSDMPQHGILKIKLKDPAGEKNYYRLRVFPAHITDNGLTRNIYNNTLYFKINNFKDDGGIFGSLNEDYMKNIYFTDETFDGEELTLTISVDAGSSGSAFVFNSLAPELTKMSRASYLYFESKRKQEENGENPFTEAVVVYNNIQNGFGIVGGVADSVVVIKRMN